MSQNVMKFNIFRHEKQLQKARLFHNEKELRDYFTQFKNKFSDYLVKDDRHKEADHIIVQAIIDGEQKQQLDFFFVNEMDNYI